jgi:uncharacterized SAM-binding protein YcdF (DUF218 family)
MFQSLLKYLLGLLAAFALLNIALGYVHPGGDANIWWIDARWMPGWLASTLLAGSAVAILTGVVVDRATIRRAAAGAALLLAALVVVDCICYVALLWSGILHAALPVPLSLITAAVLVAGARAFSFPPRRQSLPRHAAALAAAAAIAGTFPVLQMCMCGATDYRRPAAAILVFGARTYADGRPSDALSDRVRIAVELYHEGLAPLVIMSGGSGDGPVHETEAMQTLAESLGVPHGRIVRDDQGVNTRASIRNCPRFTAGPVLAVSHSYHLPRIKLEADRAGITLYTVPAPQGQPLRKLPVFVARETLAWWWYYARPA